MHLFQDNLKQNETTLGAANGIFSLEETLRTSFEAGNNLSKKITHKENKISIPNVVEKNILNTINFGAYHYQKEKIIKDFWIFKMMLRFQI